LSDLSQRLWRFSILTRLISSSTIFLGLNIRSLAERLIYISFFSLINMRTEKAIKKGTKMSTESLNSVKLKDNEAYAILSVVEAFLTGNLKKWRRLYYEEKET